ncbi:MAG TPA: hypothetical protein VKR30_00705 [Candidatus Limnocylindrales bacterium]|nr:hypothetical protein [Candidatus Limnocylindrales bacterium]
MIRRLAVPAALLGALVLVAATLTSFSPEQATAHHPGPAAPGVAGSLTSSTTTAALGAASAGSNGARPIVSADVRHDVSKPLRQVKPGPSIPGESDAYANAPLPLPGRSAAVARGGADPLVQSAPVAGAISASVVTSFDGITNLNGVLPPDTNGDIGPNDYVQWVNLSFAVYSRSGTLLYGPANGNTLWSGFGAPCETTNNGDPIAQYDALADRWVMSQFSLPNYPSGPFYMCVAVSQTGDPTGSWNRYAFKISDTKLDDYPHLTVWPDGYYLSTNQFNGNSWGGQGAVAFERSKMLAGQAAQMVYFDMYSVDPNLGGMLPSDLDGQAPPVGAPNVFVEADDDANGYPQDQLQLYDFHVDWTTPSNSTFMPDAASPLATASMNTVVCANYARNCIPQPSFQGNKTPGVDALSDRIMYRLQYRNFGSYQTLVTTNTVNVGAGQAGIRWWELRNSGSGWAIHQQGTWAPDANDRWMASAAMDGAGDIGIGYSLSSSSVYPSIEFAGRLAGDPLNTLTTTETSIMAGSGTQTSTAARWGDYSMLAVDPTDDCTFWYTNEYLATTGSAPWRTRIAAIRLPGCGGGDTTPPSVSSFAPTTSSPTNGSTISYNLTFSESVTGLAATDFTRTGTSTGCIVGTPSGSGASYSIDVTGCGDGTVILKLNANSVQDLASNVGPTSASTAATVTVDRTAPTAAVTAPASPTASTSLSFGVSFSESVSGLAAGDFGVSGTATGCLVGTPSGCSSSYTVAVTGCSDGTVTLTLNANTVSDAATNLGPTSPAASSAVLVDRTAPTVTAPGATLRSGLQISGSTLAIRVTWTGSDGGSGVASYDVARSVDGGAFALVVGGLASPAVNVGGTSGHTYRYEVRSYDHAGNVSGWLAGPTLAPSLYQQTSSAISFHGTWFSASSTSYSGGSVKYATAAGAYASYTFTGRGVAFVTTRATSRGSVKVYLDGVLVTTVSCYSTTATYRYVAFARTWASSGTHTLKLVLVGTSGRPRVDLDAIEVLR